MGLRLGGGFAAGLALGQRVGQGWVDQYKQADLEQSLGDAGQSNRATEEVVGSEASDKAAEVQALRDQAFNEARNRAIDEGGDSDAAGLAAAQQYDPAIAQLQKQGAQETPGYVVGRDRFDTQQAAQQVADRRNVQAMADVYQGAGKPAEAFKMRAAQLAIQGGEREDELATKEQPLKMGSLEGKYKLLQTQIRTGLEQGTLTHAQAQKEAIGAFVDAVEKNPPLANHLLSTDDFRGLMGIKDANYAKDDPGTLEFTMQDGSRSASKISDLKSWRHGDKPLKMTTIAEGGMLVGTDDKGNIRTSISNPKVKDPSTTLNDIQTDAKNFQSRLTQGAGTLNGLDESQQGRALDASNLYQKARGEYFDKFKQQPTPGEDAQMAELAAKRFGFGVKPKK